MQSTDYIQTNNFYFERHFCSYSEDGAGESVKVKLDIVIKDDFNGDSVLRIGMCHNCKKAFYYYGAK